MDAIPLLKKEHKEMLNTLNEIESFMNKEKNDGLLTISNILKDFSVFWNRHEEREESFFELCKDVGKPVPDEKMLLHEHKELKGHWKILENYIKLKDPDKLRVALDTDGRMLIAKFKKHISKEEAFLDEMLED